MRPTKHHCASQISITLIQAGDHFYPGWRFTSLGNLTLAFSGSASTRSIHSKVLKSRVRVRPIFGVSSLHVTSQFRRDFTVGVSTTTAITAGARVRIESSGRCIFGYWGQGKWKRRLCWITCWSGEEEALIVVVQLERTSKTSFSSMHLHESLRGIIPPNGLTLSRYRISPSKIVNFSESAWIVWFFLHSHLQWRPIKIMITIIEHG